MKLNAHRVPAVAIVVPAAIAMVGHSAFAGDSARDIARPRTLEWAEITASLATELAPELNGNMTSLAGSADLSLDFGAGDLRLGLMPQDEADKEHGTVGSAGGTSGGATDDPAALAKATQNPVADLISVPFQTNFNFGVGPNDSTQWILNIQPVIPISLGEDWNLITRTILPIINQPAPAPGVSSEFGLGDLQFTGFFSPKKPGKIIWGVGPVFQIPTATDDILGTGKFSIGPSVVVLTMHEHWVYGVLAQQVWSVAGDDDREDVSAMLIQPFINYNMEKGWYLTSSPIITADWRADSDNAWVVPIGGGAGRVMHIGKQPVNISLQAYYNVVTPDNGADWQLRFQIQLLFPK